jgi:hypothetical protein
MMEPHFISQLEKGHGNTSSNKTVQNPHFQLNVWEFLNNGFSGTWIGPKE